MANNLDLVVKLGNLTIGTSFRGVYLYLNCKDQEKQFIKDFEFHFALDVEQIWTEETGETGEAQLMFKLLKLIA